MSQQIPEPPYAYALTSSEDGAQPALQSNQSGPAERVLEATAGQAVATPMLLIFAAAGNLPQSFTMTPVFVNANVRAHEADRLPSVAAILRQVADQAPAAGSARDLIQHILSTCPSAQVWTGSALLPADFRYSPAVNTPPIGRATYHGTISAIRNGGAAAAVSPRVCYEPAAFIGQLRQALAPRLALDNPSAISVHFIFFQHFMLYDPSRPRSIAAMPHPTSTPAPRGLTADVTPPPTFHVPAPEPPLPNMAQRSAQPRAVQLPTMHVAPAAATSGAAPPAPADATQPHDTPEFLVKAIALAFPQAALDIARCLPFSMPPNQRGRRSRNPFATEYGTAYASWRIYAHIQRTCEALSLDVHEPSRTRMVRFPSQTCQVCCWDVLRAFSIAPSTWNSAKTRFANLRTAALRLQAGTTEAERRLLHKLNFFLQDVSQVDPLETPLNFLNEEAIWDWGTEAFRRELRLWTVPVASN
ncbi:hypothetical protein AURDEDRAFT_176057 [Auricularia subglabra TFB-10046 SS5]|uniref:Uncharacterized protein n=1 Tax=Auricularia subglabra (strain TFB-10046 / SS5) TaxID=717982 RepID=J0D7A0_AURST|nr:hypothetical protein AURDEDRAFT_176057 [Auricularia subglabra TFB-10046 SS5]